MQTFLPYPNFAESVKCLDWRRLGKQRVECLQLLNVLTGKTKGWANHPATKMWRGYEDALGIYMNHCIEEWVKRKYKNSMLLYPATHGVMPNWLGNPSFHASHRSNLLRKDPIYYGQFDWIEPDNLEYIWPKGDVI